MLANKAASSCHVQALDDLLTEAGFNTRIRGDCMRPAIADQSLVTVDPGARLKSGDVMVWRDRHGQLVCHRYLGRFPSRNGFGAVSWADSSTRPDGLVALKQVLGKVSHVDGEALMTGLAMRIRSRLRFLQYGAIRLVRKFRGPGRRA